MEPILYVTITQFLFAALLVLTKRARQQADMVLGSWLVVMAIFLCLTLLKEHFPGEFWGHVQVYPMGALIGPFLFLYSRSLTSTYPQLNWKSSLHLIPFGIIVLIELFFPQEVDAYFINGNFLDRGRWTYTILFILHNLTYFGLTLKILSQHRIHVKDIFSFSSLEITLQWLWVVAGIFGLSFLITLIILIAVLIWGPFINPAVPLFMGFGIFAFAISYYGVRQGIIYEQIPDSADSLPEESESKYATSSLSEKEAEQHIIRLKNFMESERPYRNRELTVQSVAETLDIPTHHLTETLNEYMGKNFYTLVNEYRIEDVKRLLLDPKYQNYTLLAIAYEAGFNSKSAFNHTFKKLCGQTPSEYRRENLA
ncbi:MAG: helix-turn-helix transcriptional regulator [Bacteroidia bacterium]